MMKELISKFLMIAKIVFCGVTILMFIIIFGEGLLGNFIPIHISIDLNSIAVIYVPLAYIFVLCMLLGRIFMALHQAFGDRLMMGNKKGATAFFVSSEKADDGATIIIAEFTVKADGSKKTVGIRTTDMSVISEFTSKRRCYVTYELDDFGNVTAVEAHSGRETGSPFVGIAFAVLYLIAIVICTWLFKIFYFQVIVEWLK